MSKKTDHPKNGTSAGKTAALLEKAKKATVHTLDLDDDGQLTVKDATIVAENIGAAAKKATTTVKDSVKGFGDRISARYDQAKKEAELKALCPIFEEDIDNPDFYLTKMIRVIEEDKKRAESDVCKGAIGYYSVHKDLRIVNIYPDKLDLFGLSFYPDKDSELYYIDPSDRDLYIALDDYFSYLKVARVSELQKIAQDLGAKHFRVTYKEQKKSFSLKTAKGHTGGRVSAKLGGGLGADHSAGESVFSKEEIAAEMTCIGHKPVEPALVYFKKDPQIQSLVSLRLSDNPITHQTYTLELSNSSGIKVKDAVKIDAAIYAMKLSGNVTVTSEAQSEARRIFEYEIDF